MSDEELLQRWTDLIGRVSDLWDTAEHRALAEELLADARRTPARMSDSERADVQGLKRFLEYRLENLQPGDTARRWVAWLDRLLAEPTAPPSPLTPATVNEAFMRWALGNGASLLHVAKLYEIDHRTLCSALRRNTLCRVTADHITTWRSFIHGESALPRSPRKAALLRAAGTKEGQ